MTINRNVLVIEDNEGNGNLIKVCLSDLGCEVTWVREGLAGLNLANSGNYDLILLDLMLPDMNGLEICRTLRDVGNHTPIMILSAKCSDVEKVLGLDSGADDYITKPFNCMELIARVKVFFRRLPSFSQDKSEDREIRIHGNLTLHPVKREVYLDSEQVDLTAKEFNILEYLSSNYGRVFTREQLLDRIWGHNYNGFEHTIDSHINRLRHKIEIDPSNPDHILTVWGVGYKFNGV